MPKAMILAAGFGTRLRPLTLELPKPLVWVGDRPAIALIAERLGQAGIREIAINTHHRPEAFSARLLGLVPGHLSIVTEPEILGTGGGLANAAELLGPGDVVVWNGDILSSLDVTLLLSAHRESALRHGSGATLAVAPRPPGQGTVGLDENGLVVRLRGELFGTETAGGDFLGISLVTEELRQTLPIPGCLVGDGLLPWLRQGGKAGAFVTDSPWDDIGSIEAYLRANRRWLREREKPFFAGEGAVIGGGVRLTDSVVGEGAKVLGEGVVEGCVIWPGATATAPLSNTVITTEGRIAGLSGAPSSEQAR